jgi:hypothetical protein
MKRPLPEGTTHLLFTGLELLRRVASLVPAPRANLTRFHGVFAPGAQPRPFLVPQAGAQEASVAPEAAASKEPKKQRMPRVHQAPLLRRTFGLDVFTCHRNARSFLGSSTVAAKAGLSSSSPGSAPA